MLKFSTSSLRAPEMALVPDAVNEAESKKFEQEFEEYQKKLKEQKDQWAKENPDQVKPDTDEWDSWFSEQDKELQQIFQGQSEMKNHLLELTRKMDDIIRRQERTMSIIGVSVNKSTCKHIFCMNSPTHIVIVVQIYREVRWPLPLEREVAVAHMLTQSDGMRLTPCSLTNGK